MSPWQVLRASRASQAALGYRVYRGLGGSVHYDSPPVAEAPDGSRSFSISLSTQRVTMQELNSRLASYLQQVQDLEEANQRLEYEIQMELDRKCPRELSELDGHLRTASLLQDQISECLSAQAQVKLQLLNAELTVVDLNLRCEKERERRGDLEVEINNLRLLDVELHVHTLPELQSVVNDHTEELMEMQIQHKQDMQGLLTQMSGGITVEIEPAESSNLIQQLDDLRETNETLMDKNRNECWFNTQVSMESSPEVIFDPPPESEVVHAELEELRGRAESLEEELTQLQALNMDLEASGLEQNDYFVEELEFLEQTADSLCRDLDSVLQATAQQAADFEFLLDVKTRLEAEIQDYMRLLDRQNSLGVLDLHANVTSFSSFDFGTNSTVNKTVNVQGGSLWMIEVPTVPRSHIDTFRQIPVVTPLSETMTTVQSIGAHSKHPENSPVTSMNTLNLTESFHNSGNQITGVFPERTGRESMTVSAMINNQSNRPVEDSSIVCTQINQVLDKEAVTASKAETNTAPRIITLVSDTQSVSSAAVQETPEIFTSKQNTTEAGLQANETGTNIQTEVTKAEVEVKQETHFVTTITDPSKPTAPEVKEETETVISAQINCTEDSIQAKNQEPAQDASLSLEIPTEAVRKAGEEVTVSIVSGSHLLTSLEAQSKVSADMTLMVDKDTGKQDKRVKEVPKVKVTSRFLRADQSLTSSDSSSTKQNKVMEDAHAKSSNVTDSSVIPDSKINIQTEITKIIRCTEPEVKQETHFVTTITDPCKPTAPEVKEEKETVISAQINCTEDSIQAKNQEPAQDASLSLETPTEAVRKAGEEVTVSIVSGSHLLTSLEAQSKVSTDMTLMVDKDTGKQDKRVKEVPKVKVTSRFLRADQSLTSSDSSSTKQNKVMEDAHTKSSIVTDSSVIPDSKIKIQTEITKTICCTEPEVKQETHFVTTITDPCKPTAPEVKEETETVISAQINCTEDSIQAKNQEPAQDASLSLEIPTEAVRKAGEEVTVSIVSGSHLLTSLEAQSKVSADMTLMVDKDTGKQDKRVKEVPKVKVTSRFLRADQSLTSSDSSSTKQNKVMEDAHTKSSIVTDSSVIPDSKINIQTEITKIIRCTEPEVKQETHFVTTITDPCKPTAPEVKEETETVISAQINCTEDSIQTKNQEPAQDASLSLEIPTEPVVDAGEDTAVSIVSGSHLLTSLEAQSKVYTDVTLMVDKDTGKQDKRVKEVPKVKVTSRFLRADQSLTSSDSSSTKQNKVMEDAHTKSSIVTDSSVIPDSKIKIQTEITKTICCTEPEVKQETHFVTTITDPCKPTAPEVKEETETVISAQINCTEDSIQAKNQEPAQDASLSLEIPTEAVRKAGEEVTVSIVSGSHLLTSLEAQSKVSADMTLMVDKDTGKQDKRVKEVPKVKVTSRFLRADQSLTSSDSSSTKQNKVMEDAHTKSSIVTDSSVIPDSKINIQTEITKIIRCTEPEVKQETHFVTTITDPCKPTAPEVKEETETVISAQINCTEDSIQTKNQEPAQDASLSLEIPTEPVVDAGEDTAVSIVSGSHLLTSLEAQSKVYTDVTLMVDKDTGKQDKRVKEVPKVKVTSRFLRADQSLTSSDSSSTKQNKVMEDADTKSSIVTDSSVIPDSNINSQTEVAKAEVEVKQETHFVTTITDPSKPTAPEVKEETETVISAQINCTEDSIQTKNQEPAQDASLSLEIPAEPVVDAGEDTAVSIVSGSHLLTSLEAQSKVSTDVTLMVDKDTGKQDKRVKEVPKVKVTSRFLRADQSLTSSDSSSTKQNKVMEDAHTKSSIVTDSSSISDSNISSQTEVTKAEVEVKQETHFVTTITDPSKPTAPEVKEETEAVISAQINCTEDSIQAKNQEPAQDASLSLEIPAEAVRKAGEEVTVSIVSGSHLLTSLEAQSKVSTDMTLMVDKDTGKQDKRVKEVPKVKVTSRFLRADQSLTSSDSSSTKQNKVMEDAHAKSSIVTDSSVIPDSNINSQTEVAKAEVEVKQETHFVTTITDPSKPTAPEVKEETETVISAQINCTEDSIQTKNQEPAQDASLSLEIPAEPVVDAGEDTAVSIVSGSHLLTSLEAQSKVSTDVTLMVDKDTGKQDKRVKEVPKVKVTSRFLRADQSLTSSDSSSTKQNKVMEDAHTKSSIVTDSSSISDSNISSQTEVTKAEVEVKQETHFVTTITDPSKPTAPEVKEETEAVISAQINCTEDSIQAKNQEPAQDASLSLEIPAEAVRKAGEEVTVSIVSGSHLLTSLEAQSKVSTDVTLMVDKDTGKQDKRVKEVPKVKVTSRFLRADQSLTSSDSSSTKQNKVMEDAHAKSSIVTDSSVIPDSKDNIHSKTAQGLIGLLSDTQSVSSAAVQETPEIFTSKQNTTEAGLQASETGTNIQTEVTKAEVEVKQETHFVTTITDPSKPTAPEVKEETETVISAQINCTEDSIQTKNQEPAQDASLSLEIPTEPVVDAGEDTAVSIVSGSHLLTSLEAQSKVYTDVTLMVDKDTGKQDKRVKEVPKVKVTSRFLRADQSLTSSDSSSTKQNKVMEDADTKSSIVTDSSVIPDSNINSQTEVTKAEVEVKQETHFVTTITDPSKPTAPEVKEETETVISAQINCTEDSIQAKNREPAQDASLSLEIPTEAVRKAGEEVTVSIVSGSHLLTSLEAQSKVSADVTLMVDKDTGKQDKRVKEVPKVKVTSRFLRADQSLTSSDSSSTKQNKVMEDADTKSSIVTDSSVIPDSKDNIHSKTAQGLIGLLSDTQSVSSAAVQETPEIFISKQNTTAAGLQANETGTNIQTEVTKDEIEVKQETHFVTTITDPCKPTAPEVKEETETVISAQINCTEDSIQAKNREPAQDASLSLEIPAEPVVDAGEDTAVSIVSGSHLLTSLEAQSKVSTDMTLMVDKDTGKQDKRVKEVQKVKVTSRFLRADQSLTSSDSSSTKQNKVMEDAHTKSSIVTDSSSISDSNISSQTEVTKAEVEVKQETHFVTTITDPSKPTAPEVKEETETVISAQINCTEDSIQAKNREPAQDASLSLEIPAEPVVDAGEDTAVSIVSGSHLLTSLEAQSKVSTDMTLMVDKDTGKQDKRVKEVPKVKVTSRFLRADQSLTSSDSSSTKQNNVMEDAHTKSSIVTDSSSISDSNISSQTEVTKAEVEVKQETHFVTTITDPSKPTAPEVKEETEAVISAQMKIGEWMLYSGSLGRKSTFARTRREESTSASVVPTTSLPEMRSSITGSGSLPSTGSTESLPTALDLETGSSGTRKFGSRGSGEWRVYGGGTGRMSSWAGSSSLHNADKEETPQLSTSPPGSQRAGRFGSAGSGEWRVYGGSTGRLSGASSADRVSVSADGDKKISSPSPGPQLSCAGSGSRLSSGSVIRRSRSVGSGSKLNSSDSGGRLSNSSGSQRASTSSKYTSTANSEWKPVYSSANARKSMGSTGRSGAGGMRVSVSSSGWLTSSTSGGNHFGSSGSGSSITGGSDRISSRAGGRINSSSGSGRTNSTGGRVISSSQRPIRSTGSGAGSIKERISVCKMAALSISAAGREKSQDRQRQAQRSQQQQKSEATSSLLQRWLSAGVGVKSGDPDGADDIMRL